MAFSSDQYELLDFGDGRRLETFGPWRLDRPCPAAEGTPRRRPELWRDAAGRFERTSGRADDRGGKSSGEGESSGEIDGRWEWFGHAPPERWTIAHGPIRLELKPCPAGHLGVFAEQAENWDWIADQVAECVARRGEPVRVLNLFAYTGGCTLAAAAAGAEVTHVDAARNTVAWARRNAELSGLADAPIRWIAEDARKFVRRELKRGNEYDAIVLDPPSYGHGPRGETWRLSKHLLGLLADCAALARGRREFLLLTCHTPGFDPARLSEMVREAFGANGQGRVETRLAAGPMPLSTAAGRPLPSGVFVRMRG